jgi:hypothetical protein
MGLDQVLLLYPTVEAALSAQAYTAVHPRRSPS